MIIYVETKDRFDFYKKKEERLQLDLEFFNKITRGGIPSKTLNICLAGTGVEKTLFMTHSLLLFYCKIKMFCISL